ncbi:hypothetical protein EDD15DRAFT_2231297 [Pisolithus albus]|nr:hypothetical protein EDD15DRAFT_2231297 [Pisolithus albus]
MRRMFLHGDYLRISLLRCFRSVPLVLACSRVHLESRPDEMHRYRRVCNMTRLSYTSPAGSQSTLAHDGLPNGPLKPTC